VGLVFCIAGASDGLFSLLSNALRILFHQGSYKDKFRKVVAWFSLRQDMSETHLKKWGHRSIKKNGQGKFKNTRALMVERNYGSNYMFLFLFRGGPNKLTLFINYI